jgi:hypothetical protein
VHPRGKTKKIYFAGGHSQGNFLQGGIAKLAYFAGDKGLFTLKEKITTTLNILI